MARKECYFYVQTIPLLLRLNLSDLCESGSSAEFEIAHNYCTSDDRVPIGMACLVVGSKIYMVGGEKAQKGSMLSEPDEENWFNTTDVYVVDHTKSESVDRLVPVRDGDGAALGRLNGPKCRPIVFTVEGKFYVLSTRPLFGSVVGYIPPVFEVFDPTPQPHRGKSSLIYTPFTSWGHKLLTIPPPIRPGFLMSDAKEEKWAEDLDFMDQFARDWDSTTQTYRPTTPVPNGAAVEFKGILFAVSLEINAIVAYDLDACGLLNAHWVLEELSDVFEGPPSLSLGLGFLTDLGGGRMCVLFGGDNNDHNWIVRVEVFRVDITTVGDRPNRPAVHREILRSFKLQSPPNHYNPMIDSVFMCDHSNKSDIEADASS